MNQQTSMGAKKLAYSSRTADKFVVRLPDGMRQKVCSAAAEAHRSMNSEIIFRIGKSLQQDEEVARLNQVVDNLLLENKRLKQMHQPEGLPA